MANAVKDENGTNSLIAVSSADGTTIVRVQVNPTNNRLKVSDGSTGSDKGPTYALRDQNDVPVILGVSSADGKTLVPIYADSLGNLLIKST